MEKKKTTSLDKSAKQFAWDGGLGQRASAPVIVEVVKWTPTQVVVKVPGYGKEKRFRIDDGREVGGNYGSRLDPVTPKVMDEIQRERYANAIASYAYKIETEIRTKVAQNPKLKQLSVDKLQVILGNIKEQHALIGDWEKTIGGGS
jgi:hypothetical protein